jgi:hypothetical protein
MAVGLSVRLEGYCTAAAVQYPSNRTLKPTAMHQTSNLP